ncbi:hypothetical protein DQ04_01721070 [Trypanosoma grayi]|uniref:hypothetical protein n=1 Tax=Trypanosoma grayi TaxID=71804 RepID=UPI0004F48874|nr:hypothetical protein DQ04_01721070 [Trypanosoma grayi]KEG12432.1 hypothetical protein DQ04_01721070 [Trypanosoma grayi]
MPRISPPGMGREMCDSDTVSGVPQLVVEQPRDAAAATQPPHVALTLSNALVQFLSPLQLQGYASRLIESCGMLHIDDLAARVTCEDDVEKLLGAQASLQHRQELWKGICKWKRPTAKRGREQARKCENKKKVAASGTGVDNAITSAPAPVVASEGPRITSNKRFGDLDVCTPSQFMRQFAFQGYRSDETAVEKPQSAHMCNNSPATVEEIVAFSPSDRGPDDETEVAEHNNAMPRRSESWASSLSPFCSSYQYPEKRCRREQMPLASLSVGPGKDLMGEDELAGVWGLHSVDVVPSENSIPSVMTPPQAEISTLPSETIWQCLAEHKKLREDMLLSVEQAVAAYNEGLQLLQQRVRTTLGGTTDKLCITQDATTLQVALELWKEPQVKVDVRPVEPCEAGISAECGEPVDRCGDEGHFSVSTMRSVPQFHANIRLSECPRDSEALRESIRPSLLANTTIISPPSGNIGEGAVPSLSDLTTPNGGSRRNTDVQALEDYARVQSTTPRDAQDVVSRLSENNGCLDFLAGLIPEAENVVTLPVSQGDRETVEPPPVAEGGNGNGEQSFYRTEATTHTTNNSDSDDDDEEVDTNVVRPFEALSPRHVGSKSPAEEDDAETISLNWRPTFGGEVFVGDGKPRTVVDSQVIDVDALSSTRSGEEEMRSLLRDDDSVDLFGNADDGGIALGDSSNFLRTHSSPMAMDALFSQEEHLRVCTQPVRQRQRAVSRNSSMSFTEEFSGDANRECPSTAARSRATALDWTEASSILTDVQHLISRLQPNEDQADDIDVGEKNLDERDMTRMVTRRTMATISPQRPAAPRGLPPLPVKNTVSATLHNFSNEVNTSVEQLTPQIVMAMSYEELRKWCMQLGLNIYNSAAYREYEEERQTREVDCSMRARSEDGNKERNASTHEENSNGWWMGDGGSCGAGDAFIVCEGDTDEEGETMDERSRRQFYGEYHSSLSPHRPGNEEQSSVSALLPPPEGDDLEWRDLRRSALTEHMREALRLFLARRKFMHEVVPAFFHRLPRFSGGPPYERVRAADLVKTQLALTRQQLEEHRRLAKAEEAEEVVRCVITSLAGETAESIERQAVSAMNTDGNDRPRSELFSTSMQSNSSLTTRNAVHPGLTVYEQLLLMEPTDVQAAASVVQADFPHVSRHRVETLLEESGIPLDATRRVCLSQGAGNENLSVTQRSASSCSPPPSQTAHTGQMEQSEHPKQSKRRFFAQRGWLRRERGR